MKKGRRRDSCGGKGGKKNETERHRNRKFGIKEDKDFWMTKKIKISVDIK